VMGQTLGSRDALDLYAGVGLFTLPLARRYRSVVAVENSPQRTVCVSETPRTLDSRTSGPCVRRCGTGFRRQAPWPRLHLIWSAGSARQGAGPEIMRSLVEWTPETIVYVSCGPADFDAGPGRVVGAPLSD